MNHSSVLYPRKDIVQLLSEERGRSPDHPLDPSLISKWSADLGFELGLQVFDDDQLLQLRVVNRHYASGGTRKELLQKMRNPKWYELKN
jgi:hypothetical protein